MVGPTGFEPATPSPPAKCATRLRYGPTQKEGERWLRARMGQALSGRVHLKVNKRRVSHHARPNAVGERVELAVNRCGTDEFQFWA